MVKAHHYEPSGKAHAMIALGTHVGVDVAMTGHVFVSFTQGTCPSKSWTNFCSSFHPFPLLSGMKTCVGSVLSVETEKVAAAERGF